MPVIELKKYDDKYLIGIISCLKRNYNRFGCMMLHCKMKCDKSY